MRDIPTVVEADVTNRIHTICVVVVAVEVAVRRAPPAGIPMHIVVAEVDVTTWANDVRIVAVDEVEVRRAKVKIFLV